MLIAIATNLVEQDEPISGRSSGGSLREMLERGVRQVLHAGLLVGQQGFQHLLIVGRTYEEKMVKFSLKT